jgi:ABC-type Fe3+ transport system permease subunit
MKTLYKTLIGFATAIIVMFVACLIIYALKIEINKVNFFVGWISCMGYYISTNAFDKWRS